MPGSSTYGFDARPRDGPREKGRPLGSTELDPVRAQALVPLFLFHLTSFPPLFCASFQSPPPTQTLTRSQSGAA